MTDPLKSSTRRKMMKALFALPVAGAINEESAGAASRDSEAQEAIALAQKYFECLLELDPVWATDLRMAAGDQANRIPIDIAPSYRENERAMHQGILARAQGVSSGSLANEERTVLALVRWIAQDRTARLQFPQHLLPLDQQAFAIPFRLANALETDLSPFATAEDFASHIERLRMLPAWSAQAVENMKRGLAAGVVHARPVIARLSPLLRTLATNDQNNPYLTPLRVRGSVLQDPQSRKLPDRYTQVVSQEVVPAMAQLADFVDRQWLPNARTTAGWSALPDGAAWYAQCVRSHTTTDWSADRIHALGLEEVRELAQRLRGLQERFGHRGTPSEFLAWHAQRPSSHPFRSEEEVLDAYRRLHATVAARLPAMFSRLPVARLEVRPEPELTRATAGEHYEPPAPDGSRAGVYYAPVPQPTAYLARTMTTLFLHEGVPGHHLQVALAQELPLTQLQKHYFHTAYGEGWALYAESLGYPLGLYEDPDAHLGHLVMAMVRAVRLVVDTGLHAKGWTYEQAVRYFSQYTGYDERAAQLQIERYMAQPGQALGYAVGRIRLEQLRDQMMARKGARASLPEFHDAVLRSGALPLSVLEQSIVGQHS